MKFKKAMLRKMSVVMCAIIAFAVLSGFTYSPSEPVKFESAAYTVTGKETTYCENLSQTTPKWFPNSLKVDGKWGRWSCDNWDSPLFLLLNDEKKYADVNTIKLYVEYYDADHGYANNNVKCCKIFYPGKDGSKKQIWARAYQKTNSWVTAEYTISDIDLTNTSLVWGASYPATIAFQPDKETVTLADGSRYRGMLIHKVVIEPVPEDETYSIKDLRTPAVIGKYSVNENSVSLVNVNAWKDAGGFEGGADTDSIRTVTDANGITLSGIPSGNIKHSDRKIMLTFDAEKFKDVKNANLTVVWFDNLDSRKDGKRLGVNYASNAVKPYEGVSQYVGGWQSFSGTWKTTVIPLSNCDFSSLRKVSKWFDSNVQLDIINGETDFGTPNDKSDDYKGLLINSVTLTPIPEYTFSGLKFTDEDGKTLNSLNAGGKFYTDLTVTRTGGDADEDLTVFIALYSADNKIEKISHLKKTIKPNGTAQFTCCFINPDDVDGKYIKVLVWDSADGMIPIANALICK